MNDFFEQLMLRAATIDELLSESFEALPGQKTDADLAARRLAAWCRSCTNGDWSLFERRLERDGLSIGQALEKFATVRRTSALTFAWLDDAVWVEAALHDSRVSLEPKHTEPCPFEHLLIPVVEQANALLWATINPRAFDNLSVSAQVGLRVSLLKELCSLCAPALYEHFVKTRKTSAPPADAEPRQNGETSKYDQFVLEMKSSGFRRMFEDKPVLLRLIASITRQWIDASRELLTRLDADLDIIRRELVHTNARGRVIRIDGGLSDPHNGGRSVQLVCFDDGSQIVYKPKDLRLDVCWHALVERLNRAGTPIELRAVRAIARDGYGWTEFVGHTECIDTEGFKLFFRRAGAWLALFHCFAGTDMHQENVIAAGDHPIPIDLEMILQATIEKNKAEDTDAQAYNSAMEAVTNSVMAVGLLPAYGKSPDNNIFAIGGVTSNSTSTSTLVWNNINTDKMRPARAKELKKAIPNLPHLAGQYARLGDHIDEFVSGFENFAKFLMLFNSSAKQTNLFDDFVGIPVRTVVRPTRFYYLLLKRLKDHRNMGDGIMWSAQADFVARLADWEEHSDLVWPLHHAERAALVSLNVPHFTRDGNDVRDGTGISIQTETISGIDHARARLRRLDEQEIAWQVDVIRQSVGRISKTDQPNLPGVKSALPLRSDVATAPTTQIFGAEADKVAEELTRYAIRRGSGAAWIGLDWLGDSEVSQLVALGPDLYNGACGIALFFAAHTSILARRSSHEMALAALSLVRKRLRGNNNARMARALGIGGALGLGSVIYSLSVISKLLQDERILQDAHVASELFTDDLIAADKQLDVMAGSAGAILGLLRLYRQTKSADVLRRATKCGQHLLKQPRNGVAGCRSWSVPGPRPLPLNGMSHGAAGFAYALASLASVTGCQEFADAASECIRFENSSYDAERNNWPDFRGAPTPLWPHHWCHGAPGIALARIAIAKTGVLDSKLLAIDVRNSLSGVERSWPGPFDTLCCGTMGSIEFFCEAGRALERRDLKDLAAQRLMAVLETAASTGYRWNTGRTRFNVGLFRGLAGVGYTLLRQVDASLPNVLIWE